LGRTEESTALSDITLSWMMDKASALGLQFDATVKAQYASPLDSKYAISKLHTSWSPACGLPITRSIPKDASIANSVALRMLSDSSWHPENLALTNGALAAAYQLVNVLRLPVASARG
jgi:hypothetical protein